MESDASLEDVEPAFCDEPPTPLKKLEESDETVHLAAELARLKSESDLQIQVLESSHDQEIERLKQRHAEELALALANQSSELQ